MTSSQAFNLTVDPAEQELALRIRDDIDRGLSFLEKQQADPAIAAFKLAIEKAAPGSPVQDLAKHNLLIAYRMRIGQLLDAGEPLVVNRYLPEVSSLTLTSQLAEESEFRGKFADLLHKLALDFYGASQHEAALFFVRKAIATEPSPAYSIDLINARARIRTPAPLDEYTTNYKRQDLGRHIFITCAPKSGSTFLKSVLSGVTGYRVMFPVFAALQNEQELDLPTLVKFGNVDTVTQQHARASEANIQLMQAFGIRPVILVRNIFDTVASLMDFYTKGFTFSTFFDTEEFLKFDDTQKVDLLIQYALPWYFQFVASWQTAERDKRLEMKWITFEDMIRDKAGTIREILAFYGLTADDAAVETVIGSLEQQKDKIRFNKGVTGRGNLVLSQSQRERIVELARPFPSSDFGILGL